MNQAQQLQLLEPDALVYLHELDGRPQGFDLWRWANTAEPNGDAVRWRGTEWPPLDLKIEGYQWGGDTIPRPKVTASLTDGEGPLPRLFLDLLVGASGGQGMKLTTWRVLACYLGGHEYEAIDPQPRPDVFYIDRATWTDTAVTWEFLAPLDLPHRGLPARFALSDTCPFKYRRWDKGRKAFVYPKSTGVCPYTGQACFDRWGAPTDQELDDCGGRLSDCLKRHPSGVVPFGGFPALGRGSQ